MRPFFFLTLGRLNQNLQHNWHKRSGNKTPVKASGTKMIKMVVKSCWCPCPEMLA